MFVQQIMKEMGCWAAIRVTDDLHPFRVAFMEGLQDLQDMLLLEIGKYVES